jgi:hypothetical protein
MTREIHKPFQGHTHQILVESAFNLVQKVFYDYDHYPCQFRLLASFAKHEDAEALYDIYQSRNKAVERIIWNHYHVVIVYKSQRKLYTLEGASKTLTPVPGNIIENLFKHNKRD